MSSPAQTLADRQNAATSIAPVTIERKARISANASRLSLVPIASFVRSAEQHIFAEFESGYLIELSPATFLEHTLAREIIQAAWRLRRCADLESTTPENATEEDLDRLQASIDRARATAQRSFHRSLAELRRIQTERVYRAIALPGAADSGSLGQASSQRLDPAALIASQLAAAETVDLPAAPQPPVRMPAPAQTNFTKQTQLSREPSASTPRSAPCPCGSREKYKRCCGRNAPAVLG